MNRELQKTDYYHHYFFYYYYCYGILLHLLETAECCFGIILLQGFGVVVLVLQVHIWL